MNITSFFVNKCFEVLLSAGIERTGPHYENPKCTPATSSTFMPPWISDPGAFIANCDGCRKCIATCENQILIIAKHNYPQVDLSRGSCTFCGECAANCPQGLFVRTDADPPWDLRASVTFDCLCHNNVLCRTCIEHCDQGAIVIQNNLGRIGSPHVLEEKCNGCGACFSTCPVRAIKIVTSGEKKE